YETDRRLYALRFWTRRVFSATVDQFLAFMQYTYGPLCLLPLLADSVVVIDEVHSFDHSMFSALKDFLKTFDVPVLCMTATLPNDRQDELAACPMTICNDKPGALRTIAEAPRYRLRRTTATEVPGRIRQALDAGQRVLWVVNQVKRAQQAVRQLARDFVPGDRQQEKLHVAPGVPLFCYHSRYKLADRVRRHNAVVDAFRADCPAALAITTQVCEMSLDMDADLLITEECPITSLIQRMGRCNRDRDPRPNAGEVLVYQPLNDEGRPDLLPYDAAALTGLEAFLGELSAQPSLNQANLEAALAKAPLPPAVGDRASSFLLSGPYARGGEEEFRDIAEFAVRAVLADDIAEFVRLKQAKQPTDGLVVPVPLRLGRRRDERLPHYLAVADGAHYHVAVGFCDDPLIPVGGPA
ncbi:MAG: CRISPR-associated helicase Cas3', partial [Planctomycetaceae bacterium]|nr:CRISPR-associated helicase Cas3' [Planctomycetaceae bacterium]